MTMIMMMMMKVMKTYHENDQPAPGSDSAKPCTFGEIWLANSGDWVFLGVRGFRCKLRSWTLLLVLHKSIKKLTQKMCQMKQFCR